MGDFFSSLGNIIKNASKDNLSMIAFLVIAICVLAYFFFARDRPRVRIVIFIVIFLGVFLLVFEFVKNDYFLSLKLPVLSNTTKSPKIIGIYPKDAFGINQKRGLIEAVKYNSSEIELIHLDFLSYNEMKSKSQTSLIDSLKKYLINENIVAISGPSITECTDDVLKAIKETKSKAPIFISSAAPRDFLNWNEYRKSINLYRIATGVDDRAQSLANFLEQSSNIKKTAVLVEKNSNSHKTYGEIFLDEILKKSKNFKQYQEEGKISILYYKRDDLSEYNRIFNSIKSEYNTILLLGVGKQFKYTVDNYYKGQFLENDLPKFGGWMFAYTMNDELKKENSSMINNKIFEITDFNLRTFSMDINSESINTFISRFGTLQPGLRDEAFSFDSGNFVVSIYNSMKRNTDFEGTNYIKFNDEALEYLNYLISNQEKPFEGVSNQIFFSEGLNTSRSLNCVIYDSVNNKWKQIEKNELMEL